MKISKNNTKLITEIMLITVKCLFFIIPLTAKTHPAIREINNRINKITESLPFSLL